MKQFLFLPTIFITLFFLFTSSVYAENTAGRDCVVIVNGVTLSSSNNVNSMPVVYSPEEEDIPGYSVYSVSVLPGVGSDFFDMPSAGVTLNSNKWNTAGWHADPLTKDGDTLYGSLSINRSNFDPFDYDPFTLDVDFGDVDVCKSVYGKFTSIKPQEVLALQDAEKTFCDSLEITPNSDITEQTSITLSFNFPSPLRGHGLDLIGVDRQYGVRIVDANNYNKFVNYNRSIGNPGFGNGVYTQNIGNLSLGNYTAELVELSNNGVNKNMSVSGSSCRKIFCIGTTQQPGRVGFTCDGTPQVTITPGEDQTPFNLCQQAGVDQTKCNTCFKQEGVWTAIGCIPFNSSVGMIRVFITIGLGIAGGVVVLMVLAGSFLLSTSQGDPKRVDEAKGLIGSAVIGLLFVIFSVTILRFIGVDILQIPGLGGIK